MDANTALVPFEGARLFTAVIEGVAHVAARPISEHLGLDWSSQRHRIMRNPALRTCVVKLSARLPGDDQSRSVLMLPIGMLSGWLFGVQVPNVRPELRDRLLAYQRESFAALDAYWRPGIALTPRVRAIADRSEVHDDKDLYPRQRFARERKRWEAETGYTLAEALGASQTRIKGLENGDKALMRGDLWLSLMGLGLDINYIYRGDRTMTDVERGIIDALRAAAPRDRQSMIGFAETLPPASAFVAIEVHEPIEDD